MAECLACDDGSPWSATWEEAREKFRAAAGACGANLEALPYDSSDGFGGVWSADELTIDVAVLGDAATASSLLLHTSGTHGVEGYALAGYFWYH